MVVVSLYPNFCLLRQQHGPVKFAKNRLISSAYRNLKGILTIYIGYSLMLFDEEYQDYEFPLT
ncbi:MAG: hypothetical protein ACFWUC_09900 [Oscillospiraceae bacterium]|jgi:hypothetical protein